MISPANTNPTVTDRGYSNVFRVCGRDDVQGAVGAEFAKSLGVKTAYVIHDKTTYGQGWRSSSRPRPRRRDQNPRLRGL